MTPLVVKLGGSLAENGRMASPLSLVSRARRPVVIVPGGGHFADAVRDAQQALGFSDACAHDLAIRAMQQMADAILALAPQLVGADTLAAMKRAFRDGRVAVWLPVRLCDRDRTIPRDWSITSDGLAARLAERLGGAEVVLVKSCTVDRSASAATLARARVVDPMFPVIVHRAALQWHVVGEGDDARLADLLGAAEKASPPARGQVSRSAPHGARTTAAAKPT